MNDRRLGREVTLVRSHSVRKSRAYGDDNVALFQGSARGIAAVHAHKTEIERSAVIDARRHERIDAGQIALIEKGYKLARSLRAAYSAAVHYYGTARLVDSLGGGFDSFVAKEVVLDGFDLRHGSILALRRRDVLGDINKHGTGTVGRRYPESLISEDHRTV